MIKLIFISLLFLSSQLQAQWGHWEKLETDTTTPGERWGIEMATIGDKKAGRYGIIFGFDCQILLDNDIHTGV